MKDNKVTGLNVGKVVTGKGTGFKQKAPKESEIFEPESAKIESKRLKIALVGKMEQER